MRLIVVGAGPAGLAAALGAVQRGWDVTVLERSEVGAALKQWGSTRFFSPLSMNLPPGADIAPSDAILTGPAFVETVLIPIANALGDRIKTRHRVASVGRAGLTRSDYAGHPIRAERPFRLLVATPQGERTFEAEAVIDASGVYGQPIALAVPGERAQAHRFIRTLGALHGRLNSLAGKRVLVIGHGHSAANAMLQLAGLSETRVVWATRSLNRRPCVEVAFDPLPERQRVVFEANQLAAQPPNWLTMERRASVESIAAEDGALRVTLTGDRTTLADEIVVLTGYRPDLSFLSELALEIHPATEGAARLANALANVTDCLSLPSLAPADLESGEPGFCFAGAKSYGRARTFLLQTGYRQIDTALESLSAKP